MYSTTSSPHRACESRDARFGPGVPIDGNRGEFRVREPSTVSEKVASASHLFRSENASGAIFSEFFARVPSDSPNLPRAHRPLTTNRPGRTLKNTKNAMSHAIARVVPVFCGERKVRARRILGIVSRKISSARVRSSSLFGVPTRRDARPARTSLTVRVPRP